MTGPSTDLRQTGLEYFNYVANFRVNPIGAAYSGAGGAAGEVTGASVNGGTYTYSAGFDLLDRTTDLKVTKTSGGSTLFDQSRTFDAAGNVATTSTTLSRARTTRPSATTSRTA